MNSFHKLAVVAAAAALMTACGSDRPTKSGLVRSDFETEIDGKQTSLYTLTNKNGVEVCITNFGGRVVSIMVPDRDGNLRDVVLGFDNVKDYIEVPSDFGAAVGRYANRINQGRFTLDGVEYDLPKNNFGHCLHGGPTGWQYRIYTVEKKGGDFITLRMDSPDGDNNFPGSVTARVTYRLTEDNALDIGYEATTDAPTVINMTNHSYFNLSGDPANSVCDDMLRINALYYTPVDDTYMTTGAIDPVEGTPMDFFTTKRIGEEINADFEQIRNGNGYDHNWVLTDASGIGGEPAAELRSEASGIVLKVYTDEPGIQVYTGNFLDGTVTGKHGKTYAQRTGICLETQHYPDSPNKANFPDVVLRPGEVYTSHCVYAFSTDNK